ncbi:MFS transporter [Desulfomarina profundi]|uniref:MFS transporter n=1 Tax=Desulfomarina profundi TaxID=2772557 RepID=A0A8D5JI46_9BACT|nr:MFS transporter [Desulfomarina profundi]BCL62269.1 MFS transporter [Desulfomarina profundi]
MTASQSPFGIANIRLFIAFRVFFNCRFYYPVFTILFLDYGLTIEQFALLNTIWAITIVLAEVPSGALADVFGRKTLIVITSFLMVIEMLVIAILPLGNSTLIFWGFLINRVLSGLAEAMASGADEAIAYDSLVVEGDVKDWPKVLSVQMRLRSIATIITATSGALLYDPAIVNRILNWAGSSASVNQQITMRFPVYLTLVLAVLACITALMMQENQKDTENNKEKYSMVKALEMTWQAGKWIGRTPFALAVILLGMCYDHVLRMIVTMTSQYFRLINLPEASFGFISSAMALLGLVTPKVAEYMVGRFSATQNMLWVAAVTLTGLFGLTGFFPYFGILPMACIFIGLMLVSFFTSHYLNQVTESYQRATVLSFKGLAFNLAYGLIGVFFAMLIQYQRRTFHNAHPLWIADNIKNLAFKNAINWFPWYTIVVLSLIIFYCGYRLKGKK